MHERKMQLYFWVACLAVVSVHFTHWETVENAGPVAEIGEKRESEEGLQILTEKVGELWCIVIDCSPGFGISSSSNEWKVLFISLLLSVNYIRLVLFIS